MRLCSGIVVACISLCLAPKAYAVAPLFTETPLRNTQQARALLERLAQKPAGLDQPERVRLTSARHYKAIVILLQFPPDPAIPNDPGWMADTLAHPPEAYDSLLFSVGTRRLGSLRDYYREISRGLFDIDGVVTRWYTAPHPYSYYTANASGLGGSPNNARQMALDAVTMADADYDFRNFDNDGPDLIPDSGDDDGVVDGVFIVHAGPGAEETASKSDIYSHKWTIVGQGYSSNDIGAGGPIVVSAYSTEPEKWAGLAPHTSPNLIMSVGTFCHEFGHVLGLPDLYDVSDIPTASEGVGEWDLMAAGNFTHAPGETLGTSPAHMSAWSKWKLGWIDPVNVTTDQTGVSIAPVESGGTVYRLWTNGASGNEYFLIENRQPIGFDTGLVRTPVEEEGVRAHGLLIYHIDDSVSDNNNAAHKLVDVEEAGGAESVSGPAGVQNLDLNRRTITSQKTCAGSVIVSGNRGDKYDPWPGALLAGNFSSASCPPSLSSCGAFTQVAIQNIAENAGTITADLRIRAASVRRLAPQVEDAPLAGTPNDGDGYAEPGEKVKVRIPLLNTNGAPSPPLYAKLQTLDSFTTLMGGDSIYYGPIAPAQPDSGNALDLTVNLSPDPIGAWCRYSLFTASGRVEVDTLQILLGARTGLCDNFESTSQRWYSTANACGNVNEWHRDNASNHTTSGTYSWKLGPAGTGVGSYAASEDARLVSQPVRLTGSGDTLYFYQRYGTSAGEGLSVEISTDGGASWTLLHPVPDYPLGDRWSWPPQPSYAQAKVPLTGYSGVVQLGFRFRSLLNGGGQGWWIDDVLVSGDAVCATTGAEVIPLAARYDAARARVVVEWDLGGAGVSSVGIDRALDLASRVRVATPTGYFGPGSWEDLDVAAGRSQSYWVLVSHDGAPDTEYGPVEVTIPASAQAPRVLGLGPVRPNPFNPEATIPVSLDRDGRFTLRVYRVDGALVRTLHDGPGTAGVYAFPWNGRDAGGREAAAGVYLIELKSTGRTRLEKAVLIR